MSDEDLKTDRPLLDESERGFLKSLNSNGLFLPSQIERFEKFNRYGYFDPYNRINGSKEYVFFTKPDLQIFKESAIGVLSNSFNNVSMFVEANQSDRDVLTQLQYSVNPANPFCQLLYNKRSSNIDLPSIEATTEETSANIYGTKMTYRRSSVHSDESYDFSIEFNDTNNLEVYKFFKLYDEYHRRKFFGKVEIPDHFIFEKKIHTDFFIFKFTVDEEYERIIHYAKYYGCYPIGVPRDSLSELPSEGGLKFTTNWKCQFVEDLEPAIISEFNILCNKMTSSGDPVLPVYDSSIGGINNEWAKCPFIERRYSNGRNNYYLKWRG